MIGGNTTGTIQIRTTTKNDIGEAVKAWTDIQSIKGWLDFMSGDARYNTYNAKIQESTHLFICDYLDLDARIKSENSRMIVNGSVYDITYIDNPMGLNQHLEIFLTYTGGAA